MPEPFGRKIRFFYPSVVSLYLNAVLGIMYKHAHDKNFVCKNLLKDVRLKKTRNKHIYSFITFLSKI